MDEASRMTRAREMGFYTHMPLYHGTSKTFSAFDKGRAGAMTQAESARMGVWTALDPAIAEEFATMAHKRIGGSPQIYPLFHRAEKPGEIHLTGEERIPQIAATLDDLWSQGFDAVLFHNYTTSGGRVGSILVVKEPTQLRSQYARFDPSKRNRPSYSQAVPEQRSLLEPRLAGPIRNSKP
jgi:hypothetical protein